MRRGHIVISRQQSNRLSERKQTKEIESDDDETVEIRVLDPIVVGNSPNNANSKATLQLNSGAQVSKR